jgi:hypothetical protein
LLSRRFCSGSTCRDEKKGDEAIAKAKEMALKF